MFYNITGAVAMFVGRFFMIIPAMAIAGSLAAKKSVPASAGTFPTTGGLFVGLVVIVSCSTIGPSARAGKNVRPPTIRITPTSEADEQPAVGRERASRGRTDLLVRQRAGDRHGRDDHEEAADEHRDGAGRYCRRACCR